MSEDLISIVVPVYNVERYLDRCIKSLLNQTYVNLEIILVNDGSKDSSGTICDKYLELDNRIVVVHKENGGLSSARNAGLKVAKGKYIGFVDSDDDVDFRMFELMYKTIVEQEVDFVMSDYIRIVGQEKYLKTLDIQQGRYDKEKIRNEIFPQLIMGENLEYGPLLSACHCLYKVSFLKKHKLNFDEEVRWSEDNIFSSFVGYYANSFYYLKGEGLYHYYCNPGTITTAYRQGAWNVYCTMNSHLHQFFDEVTDYDFQRQLKLHIIFYACNCLGQLKTSTLTFKEQMKIRNKIMNSDYLKEAFKKLKLPKWNWKLKIQVLLIKYKMKYFYTLISR